MDIPSNRQPLWLTGVADPDPSDTYVFRPHGPGSGSISQKYWSGSGSYYHQAKIVRKTLIPNALWPLFDFLSLKNEINVPLKNKKQKNLKKFCCCLLPSWRSLTKIAGSGSASGSISQRHGSANADPDPRQNFMDPQHQLSRKSFQSYSVYVYV